MKKTLEDLYWEKEELNDSRWKIERKMQSLSRRGKTAKTLLSQYYNTLLALRELETQIALQENSPYGYCA